MKNPSESFSLSTNPVISRVPNKLLTIWSCRFMEPRLATCNSLFTEATLLNSNKLLKRVVEDTNLMQTRPWCRKRKWSIKSRDMNKSKLYKGPATSFVPPIAKGGFEDPRLRWHKCAAIWYQVHCDMHVKTNQLKENAACPMNKTPASFPAHGQLGGGGLSAYLTVVHRAG